MVKPGRKGPISRRERTDVLLRLILIAAFSSLAYYAMHADWLVLRNIEVEGGIRMSDREIIDLAGLNDFEDAWTICIPREMICEQLVSIPLIESAEISITGPQSIRIQITERRPVAAIDYNGFKFLFDQAGDLLEILDPEDLCLYPVVRGVPLGLLRYNNQPLHLQARVWSLPPGSDNPESMDTQFDRLINLRYMLDRYASDREEDLQWIRMDNSGNIQVEYLGYPPVLLGKFHEPELQFRRMLAVLDEPRINNPEKTTLIDLSSEKFPCYHVREDFFSPIELSAIDEWNIENSDTDGENGNNVDASQTDSSDESRTDEEEIDLSIFDLAN